MQSRMRHAGILCNLATNLFMIRHQKNFSENMEQSHWNKNSKVKVNLTCKCSTIIKSLSMILINHLLGTERPYLCNRTVVQLKNGQLVYLENVDKENLHFWTMSHKLFQRFTIKAQRIHANLKACSRLRLWHHVYRWEQ